MFLVDENEKIRGAANIGQNLYQYDALNNDRATACQPRVDGTA
jgi:hypothetical protein